MGSATLPGSLTVAQRTSFWLGFLREQESKPKGYWEGDKRSLPFLGKDNRWYGPVFARAAIRKDRIKPLRDAMPSERKKPTPKGRASQGKVRPPGYHLRPKGASGSKGTIVLASATLPGSIAPNVGELRAQLALNDARAARKAQVRQALGH